MFSPFTKSLEVVATWVSQLFEIGSVDLGVSIKCSEVLVNDCCVQINNEAAGKGFGESVFVLVEQVHVIFESDFFSLTENPGFDNTGNHAAFFFFGGEAPYNAIKALGVKPLFCLLVMHDGIRLFSTGDRPNRTAAPQMRGIDQRHSPGFGVSPQMVLDSKVNDRPGRDLNAQLFEGESLKGRRGRRCRRVSFGDADE